MLKNISNSIFILMLLITMGRITAQEKIDSSTWIKVVSESAPSLRMDILSILEPHQKFSKTGC